jgi:hypothetical protein
MQVWAPLLATMPKIPPLAVPTTGNTSTTKMHQQVTTPTYLAFNGQRPATNQGDITFYAIGNAANNNNNASGDLVYTTTREISFNTNVTQVAAGSSLLNAYPNPATEMLNISYSLQKADQTTLILTDLSGKTVATLVNNEYKNAGQYTQTLPLDDIAAGIYMLQISNKHASYLQKIVVTK